MRIEEIVREKRAVKVDELAKILNVSEMTIRRDLEKCERDGMIERCHGGAIIRSEFANEAFYNEKTSKNIEAKQRIAEYAATLVKEGMTVYLDSGTTVFQIAQKITKIQNLTVVTNDLAIATYLSTQANYRLIMIGGAVQNTLGCIHGNIAQQMLQNINVDTVFGGGLAINESFDLFARDERKTEYRQLLIKQSRNSYLVVDESKFMKISLFRVHGIEEYTGVITNKIFWEEEKKLAEDKGINLITV